MVYQSSGSGFGWSFYPAVMLVILGFLQVFTGLLGIAGNEVYLVPEEYLLQLDSTTWGWVHFVFGLIGLAAGVGLFRGSAWARTLGLLVAVLSTLGTFFWLPYFPLWGVVILALDLLVIWALIVHGAAIVDEA